MFAYFARDWRMPYAAWSLIRRTEFSPIWEIGQNSAPGLDPSDLEPLLHGFCSVVIDVGTTFFIAFPPDDESTRLVVVIGYVQRDCLCPAQANGVENPDEGGIPEVGWTATPARPKQRAQLSSERCPASGPTFTPDYRKVDGPLKVLGAHRPEPAMPPGGSAGRRPGANLSCGRGCIAQPGRLAGPGCAGSPIAARAAP
jgi:hypothetical protein